MIQEGARWIIGDGSKVRVWSDEWLPGDANNTPRSTSNILNSDLLVKDLLIPGTAYWDIPKVRLLIHHEDVDRILSLRPSITGNPDFIHWKYSKSGAYTVKTGYHIQRQLDNASETTHQVNPSSSDTDLNKTLERIWKLNIPPKLKKILVESTSQWSASC